MPVKPLQRCNYPLCAELVEWGKCEAHRVAANKEIDRYRGSSSARGYDRDWQKIRKRVLERDKHICQGDDCLGQDRITPASHVDHIIPHEGKDDPLFRDESNLQSLCRRCHSKKTAAEDGGFGNTKTIKPKTIKQLTAPPKVPWWKTYKKD